MSPLGPFDSYVDSSQLPLNVDDSDLLPDQADPKPDPPDVMTTLSSAIHLFCAARFN